MAIYEINMLMTCMVAFQLGKQLINAGITSSSLALTQIPYCQFPARACIWGKNREKKESQWRQRILGDRILRKKERANQRGSVRLCINYSSVTKTTQNNKTLRPVKKQKNQTVWSSEVWNLRLELEYMLSHRELIISLVIHPFLLLPQWCRKEM